MSGTFWSLFILGLLAVLWPLRTIIWFARNTAVVPIIAWVLEFCGILLIILAIMSLYA